MINLLFVKKKNHKNPNSFKRMILQKVKITQIVYDNPGEIEHFIPWGGIYVFEIWG